MIVVTTMQEHLDAITPQVWQTKPSQAERAALVTGHAWTGLVDGRPIGCAGVVEIWKGRAYAWALLDKDAGQHMLGLTREIKKRLAWLPFRRIEMSVVAGFDAGMRWAEMLGFTLETPKPVAMYTPDGQSAYLYAKVM